MAANLPSNADFRTFDMLSFSKWLSQTWQNISQVLLTSNPVHSAVISDTLRQGNGVLWKPLESSRFTIDSIKNWIVNFETVWCEDFADCYDIVAKLRYISVNNDSLKSQLWAIENPEDKYTTIWNMPWLEKYKPGSTKVFWPSDARGNRFSELNIKAINKLYDLYGINRGELERKLRADKGIDTDFDNEQGGQIWILHVTDDWGLWTYYHGWVVRHFHEDKAELQFNKETIMTFPIKK